MFWALAHPLQGDGFGGSAAAHAGERVVWPQRLPAGRRSAVPLQTSVDGLALGLRDPRGVPAIAAARWSSSARVRHPAAALHRRGTKPAHIVLLFIHGTMGNDTLSRQFAIEAQIRAIDHCSDLQELRSLAKSLLSAWYLQSDLTREFGAQALGMAQRP